MRYIHGLLVVASMILSTAACLVTAPLGIIVVFLYMMACVVIVPRNAWDFTEMIAYLCFGPVMLAVKHLDWYGEYIDRLERQGDYP